MADNQQMQKPPKILVSPSLVHPSAPISAVHGGEAEKTQAFNNQSALSEYAAREGAC